MIITVKSNHIDKTIPDGEYNLTKPKKIRSLNQNSYMYGVVYSILADELGYSINEIHEEMKRRFLPKRGKLELPVSTSDLSTIEVEKYLMQIRVFASSELDIFIPLPNEALIE